MTTKGWKTKLNEVTWGVLQRRNFFLPLMLHVFLLLLPSSSLLLLFAGGAGGAVLTHDITNGGRGVGQTYRSKERDYVEMC